AIYTLSLHDALPISMVELEPVLSEELINAGTYNHAGDLEAHGRVDVFKNLLNSDVERLHVLISRHAKATGSKRAADILANWKDRSEEHTSELQSPYD